jgi:signal transduction histidine kinase/CheY-like chemotaxis protein
MLVVALLLGGFLGAVEYISLKRSLNKQVAADLGALRLRLQQMLETPVSDRDESDMEQILRMEMCDRNIQGLAVYDVHRRDVPVVLGRDSAWEPVLLDAVPDETDHVEEVELQRDGTTVARVHIFLTDRFILQELRRYVFFTVLKVAVVEVIFIMMLFIIVKKVTDRLRVGIDMVESLSHGKVDRIEHYSEDDEIGDLVDAVNSVIDLFEVEQREKMKMQEQVFHSSKLASIGKLAAGVAHEVNNPLMVIQGYSEFLGDCVEKCGSQECRRYLENIQGAVSRIKKIVDGLRVYARHDADDKDVTVLDVNACVQRCCELVSTIYRNQEIQVDVQLMAERPFVCGSEGHVQQLLMNLLANARDAVDEVANKKIAIKTENRADQVLVEVRDNGCGIAEDILHRVYDPFFTTKEVGRGTGLGLGICYNIVKRMNGHMEVETVAGQGAVFRVTLPVCSVEKAENAATPLPQDTSGEKEEQTPENCSGHILFVDDESLIREMFTLVLSDTHVSVDTASCGREALDKLEQQRYDLVVADYCMPEMTGGELFQLMAERGIDAGRFILTGGVTDDLEGEMGPLLDGYLTKPLSRDDIISAVCGYLAERKSA